MSTYRTPVYFDAPVKITRRRQPKAGEVVGRVRPAKSTKRGYAQERFLTEAGVFEGQRVGNVPVTDIENGYVIVGTWVVREPKAQATEEDLTKLTKAQLIARFTAR